MEQFETEARRTHPVRRNDGISVFVPADAHSGCRTEEFSSLLPLQVCPETTQADGSAFRSEGNCPNMESRHGASLSSGLYCGPCSSQFRKIFVVQRSRAPWDIFESRELARRARGDTKRWCGCVEP